MKQACDEECLDVSKKNHVYKKMIANIFFLAFGLGCFNVVDDQNKNGLKSGQIICTEIRIWIRAICEREGKKTS